MTELNVRMIDPRDGVSEIDDAVYRVYFWRRHLGGFASREFELSEANDVLTVLAWAERNATAGETHAIYLAVVVRDDQKCLIRLIGTDPTRNQP